MRRFSIVLIVPVLMFSFCIRQELKLMDSVSVSDVSIAGIPDGSYTGSYESGGFTYSVRCILSEGRIDKIKILQNRTTRQAKLAEGVIPKVIEQQKLNVELITGAEANSKIILKAVERALTKNIPKTE
jgi:uncharacterized protein with FMN-binding domain